jgi:hypothetical protein
MIEPTLVTLYWWPAAQFAMCKFVGRRCEAAFLHQQSRAWRDMSGVQMHMHVFGELLRGFQNR